MLKAEILIKFRKNPTVSESVKLDKAICMRETDVSDTKSVVVFVVFEMKALQASHGNV